MVLGWSKDISSCDAKNYPNDGVYEDPRQISFQNSEVSLRTVLQQYKKMALLFLFDTLVKAKPLLPGPLTRLQKGTSKETPLTPFMALLTLKREAKL